MPPTNFSLNINEGKDTNGQIFCYTKTQTSVAICTWKALLLKHWVKGKRYGQADHLVRAWSQCAKVAGLIPSQGTYKN